MIRLGITVGDPAGIGPEIVAAALRFRALSPSIAYVVYGNPLPFECGHPVTEIATAEEASEPGRIYRIPIAGRRVASGKPSGTSGRIALATLEACMADLLSGAVRGVVNAPVSKAHIRMSAPDFIGHTEFYAAHAGIADPVMTFHGDEFNLALLTTHVPVCEVGERLDGASVERKLRLVWAEAARHREKPAIAMLAVDPHAGETGGDTDARIAAILHRLAVEGIRIDGPFSADSFFPRHADEYDWVIAAAHDQGLIPFKLLNPGRGVNVTLGLPFVRASVDHGTAFEIAGRNKADESSLSAALRYAETALEPGRRIPEVPYSMFARYYDRYMEHVSYDEWTDLILDRFRALTGHGPVHALELACGTAGIATRLVGRGIPTDACDGCPEMLREAFRKPNRPTLFRADMLAALPAGVYDLAVLIFDSLNYLPDRALVDTLLEQVARALQPGGVFIFDISTLRNSKENFDGLMNIEEFPDCTMIHTSILNSTRTFQETRLLFFVREGATIRRVEERHRQRVYRVAELLECIAASPMRLEEIRAPEEPDNLTGVRPQRLDNLFPRLFFVLRKP